MKSKNQQCITNIQWLCKTLRLNGSKVIHAKPKQLSRRREVFEKFTSRRKPKIHVSGQVSEIHNCLRRSEWKSWEIWAIPIRNTWTAEQAVRRVKESTASVVVQSALQESWWAEAMECYCYSSKQFAKRLTNVGSNSPFDGPVIPFGLEATWYTISAKGQSRLHQFGTKVFLGYSRNTLWTRQEVGRVLSWKRKRKIPNCCHHLKCT